MKHVLLTVVFLGIACVAMAHELLSPNGNLKLNVVLDSEGGPVYSLYYKGEPVVEPSALGILMEEADLSNGFRILDATNSTFDETWMPVWGEYEKVRNHYNELTVTFSQPAKHDRTMIVRFRLFDDGLGFRYELPEQKTMNYLTVKDELTEFNLTGNHTLYCIPGDYDTNEFAYTTAAISEVREAMERNLRKKGYEAKATSFTVQTPLMIKTTEGLYINIHEAALVDYSAMLLNVDDKEFNFSAHLTPDKLGKKGYLQLPLHTPWRTIMVSDDARSILASQLILNLNEPCKLEDTSWIKPQKFIGVWWEMFTGGGGTWAYSDYYIAVCVMFFLLFFWQVNGKREKWGIRIIFLVAHFGISYLIYRGIAGTWFMAAGDYMEGQSNWGSEPAAECVKNVLRVVKNQLLTVGPRNFSFYVIGVLLAFYVIWIAWTRRTESGRAGFWIFAAGMIFMLITPFLMTIYAGAMLVTRTQFALPVVAAFLAMFGVMILKEQQISDVRPEKQERDRKMCRWLQVMGNVVILLVIAVTGGQVCYNIRMHSADQVRYEQDALLADQITDALKREIPGVDAEGDPVDKKVVFIGYRQPQLNSLNRRTEMYGWSFFEWDYTREHPAGATHRIAGFLEAHNGVHLDDGYSEEMEYKAAALSEDMTVFPAEGSIVEEKDLVVVKLSEITERPAVDWW